MELKEINRIQDFGVYQKFNWDNTVPKFSVFNLYYGWNYSGKTTLSRVLRCFEIGSRHLDYPNALFTIEDTAGNKYSETHFPNKLAIRVFNSDFISENLKWSEGKGSIEPILLIGQENIELQSELEKEKALLNTALANLLQLSKERQAATDRLQNALTAKAREIKNTFSIPDYTKIIFERKVQDITDKSSQTPLPANERTRLLSIYRSTEKKNLITYISCHVIDFNNLLEEANTLLSASVTAKVIEKLKEDANLNAWVKTGKEIHKNKTNCEFCGEPIPPDLLNNLEKHFSKDYEALIENIKAKIRIIESAKIKLSLPDTANLYPEFQDEYKNITLELVSAIETLNNSLQSIKDSLEIKKSNVFEKNTSTSNTDNTKTIIELISQVNTVIDKHNHKSTDFETQRNKALEELILDDALEFSIAQKYSESKISIIALQERMKEAQLEIDKVSETVKLIEKQLSETVKGAEKINEYLSQYFGKDDIKVKVDPANSFHLYRADTIAKNLSEGEKTAIAFAYFVTRLEDRNTSLCDTVVYIDDPISSLDSNHLFNTYSFIKDKFYEYDTTAKKHKCKAAQFFISTHNYEFFNLIKDWFDKMKKDDRSFYMIERASNSQRDESYIKHLPVQLLKFKSEYSYLFSILLTYKTNPTQDFDQLYNLPNILRRFIETFTAFKYLSTRNIEENIERLIKNPVKCEQVRKFVHYYSHSLTTDRMMQFSDLTECTTVVDTVLDSVKALDIEHYDSLVAEVSIPNTTPVGTGANS